MQWYYSKDRTQLGPVSEEELKAKISRGEVTGSDLVWREGMPEWRRVAAVRELAPPSELGPRTSPSVPPAAPYQTPQTVAVPASDASTAMGLAIASLVCGLIGIITCTFVTGIAAVVCGHMALSRIPEDGGNSNARGLAVAGLVMGWLSVAVMVLIILFFVGAFFTAVSSAA